MNKRKDQLKSLFGVSEPPLETKSTVPPQPANTQPQNPAPQAEAPKRSASGAVKAMGLSLGALGQELEDARRQRERLETAERVVELDPDMIERSPYRDRLTSEQVADAMFEPLKKSILEHGQQVPVVVRPHPDATKAAAGFFQAAYGHRRIEATRQLELPVRAIIRQLSDAELVTAQGRENGERRDLSYIERANFAETLQRAGFERPVIMAALGVDKTELSRLLQVAEGIPLRFIAQIGPAPKVGRPRWMALAALFERESKQVIADDETSRERFRQADTDKRFQILFDRLAGTQKPAKPQETGIDSHSGSRIAELQRKPGKAVLVIPAKAGAGFADFVASELPRLHAEFQRKREENG